MELVSEQYKPVNIGTETMEIVLQDDRGQHHTNFIYETGELVAGVLRVATHETLTASDVSIELIGVTEVDWTPSKVYGVYASVQIAPPAAFQDVKRCLELKHQVSDQDIKQNNGVKEVTFKFQLPLRGIPSSFRGVDGSIVYMIVAKVKGLVDEEQTFEREIQVLAPIRERLNIPVINTTEKNFGVLSLGHGKITLHVSLPKKGYAPGDTIVLHCDVVNDSSVETTPRATLHQTQVYMFGKTHKATQSMITETLVGKPVTNGEHGTEILSIPIPNEISLSNKSDSISIKYFIHVTLDIPHAFDVHANLPFVVTSKSALSPPL